ncbi:nucleolar and spindle-associated protein 1-like isoform X2 [Branchiostoma lanceolatum]|uniref:nucleolar and spindle-associated protein 1-like isoform X2 n=1 Tax=Branchiostoma lanceolatum TaxID=7740 RepID=UPI0034513E23
MTAKEVDVDALGSMKRSELQKLAKQAGIKANMKTGDLISALQQYHSKKQDGDKNNTESTTQSSDYKTCTDASSADSSAETSAPEPEVPAKVTKRRGRRPKKAAKKATVNASLDTTADSVESNTDVSTEETPEAKVNRRGGRTRAGRGKKTSTPVNTTTTDSELEKVVSPVSPAEKPVERRSRSKSKTPTPAQEKAASVSPAEKPTERRSRSKSKTPTPPQVPAARRSRSKSKTPTSAGKAKAAVEPPKPQTPLLSMESPPAVLRRSKRSKTPTSSDDEKPQSGKRGSSGPRAKKIKRDTFEIEKKEEETEATEAVAMGAEEKAALEAEVMAELKKRVDAKLPAKDQTAPSSTSIPRFSAYLQKSNKKPVTPGNKDWDKIHNKGFKKMESIDVYLARKRKMTDAFTASVKKAKLVADEAKATVQSLKTKPTPRATGTPAGITPGRRSMAMKTPGSNKSGRVVKPVARRSSVVRKTPSSIMKSTPGTNTSSQAKPKTTAEKAVKFRPSALKPPTKLVLPALPSAFAKPEQPASARKSVGQHITPFKFTAGSNVTFNSTMNTTMNSTMNSTFTSPAPKPTFDLKASKQKPLTYKPHSGALRPLNEEEEKKQKEKVDRYLQAKQMYKRPVIKSRDDRRKKMQENRGKAKDSRMLARRGIEC